MYLGYLFDIDDVLGIFSVWTNDLRASSNLENKNVYSLVDLRSNPLEK